MGQHDNRAEQAVGLEAALCLSEIGRGELEGLATAIRVKKADRS